MLIWLVRIGNVAALVIFLADAIAHWDNMSFSYWTQRLFYFSVPIFLGLNIFVLFTKVQSGAVVSERFANIWPFILFKRLALQERKKIEELEKGKIQK